MGLDVTAYEKATLVQVMSVNEYNNNEDAQASVDRDACLYYLYQDGERSQSDGMVDGIYTMNGGASFGFDAGSYGGYNAWRNQLARMMLDMTDRQVWDADEGSLAGRPFVDLINFSDCEGFIGPKTCAKLSADFANNQEKANMGDERFRARYADWRKAFALASEGGVVRFH